MRAPRFRVECMECGKRWSTTNTVPQCPKCGGVDVELDEEVLPRLANDPAAAQVRADRERACVMAKFSESDLEECER